MKIQLCHHGCLKYNIIIMQDSQILINQHEWKWFVCCRLTTIESGISISTEKLNVLYTNALTLKVHTEKKEEKMQNFMRIILKTLANQRFLLTPMPNAAHSEMTLVGGLQRTSSSSIRLTDSELNLCRK
jgi:hypothetical protein